MSSEKVNHPAHYNVGRIEVIDAIEAWRLGFNLGNAVKYIARCEHKGAKLEDLEKARWYLNREISNVSTVVEVANPTGLERVPAHIVEEADVLGVMRGDKIFIAKDRYVTNAAGKEMDRAAWDRDYGTSEANCWLVTLGPGKDVTLEPNKQRLDSTAPIEDHILNFLNRRPLQHFHVDEIAEGSGIAKRRLATCLSRLVRRRVVTRVRRGCYKRR